MRWRTGWVFFLKSIFVWFVRDLISVSLPFIFSGPKPWNFVKFQSVRFAVPRQQIIQSPITLFSQAAWDSLLDWPARPLVWWNLYTSVKWMVTIWVETVGPGLEDPCHSFSIYTLHQMGPMRIYMYLCVTFRMRRVAETFEQLGWDPYRAHGCCILWRGFFHAWKTLLIGVVLHWIYLTDPCKHMM